MSTPMSSLFVGTQGYAYNWNWSHVRCQILRRRRLLCLPFVLLLAVVNRRCRVSPDLPHHVEISRAGSPRIFRLTHHVPDRSAVERNRHTDHGPMGPRRRVTPAVRRRQRVASTHFPSRVTTRAAAAARRQPQQEEPNSAPPPSSKEELADSGGVSTNNAAVGGNDDEEGINAPFPDTLMVADSKGNNERNDHLSDESDVVPGFSCKQQPKHKSIQPAAIIAISADSGVKDESSLCFSKLGKPFPIQTLLVRASL